MKQTPNINLPILEQGDKYLKETQNEAFSVIDREIAGLNSAISVLDNVEGSIVDTKSDVETLKNETNTLKASLNDMASNVIPNIQTSLDTIENDKINKISKLVYKKEGLSWADSIQQIEDEANQLYLSEGVKVKLKFPENELIEIDKTIYKKSGVDWVGSCKIKRISSDTSNLWALVVAENQSNFIIDNISFENLGHEIAYNISQSWSINKRNCCIHTYKCDDFTISNCNFTKYSEGIVNTGCKRYSIINNKLNANVQGKSIEQFLDDSYVSIAGSQTGDIVGWVLGQEANLYNEDFIISNNHCLSVGLRIGIEVMTQSATHSRGIISNNIIKGLHHGIKLYKGTYGELSNAVTNVKQCIIVNNQLSYCREVGIYIRANIGVLCNGNFISYCGLFNTGAGTSFGGIVLRISAETTDTNSSLDAGNFVTNNYVYNCGKSTGKEVIPYGIQVRNASAKISNNYVVQDAEYITKKGMGILIGMGDNSQNSFISNNKIVNFANGIRVDNPGSTIENLQTILGNNITACLNGIITDCNSNVNTKIVVKDNVMYDVNNGVAIRKTLNARILSNYIEKATGSAILIQSGCFEDNTDRTGATTVVSNNVIENAVKSHEVRETVDGDTTFAGRCKYWANDLVDGIVKP